MKIRSLLLCLILINAYANSAFAQDQVFQKLQTAQMQVLQTTDQIENERKQLYPWLARIFLNHRLAYRVDYAKDASSDKCRSDLWKAQQKENRTFQSITKSIQNYLEQCHDEIIDGWDDPLSNTYKTMMGQIEFDPRKYEHGRFVLFHLQGGIQLKGFLALHDDQKKRPLIIFRLGIFSNTSEFYPERFLFRQLFEQSDFNMLILESNSGQEFIHRNKKNLIGGYHEGLQNFEVAKIIQGSNQPLSKLITHVHLLGMSFGGHGVLYASLLNDQEQKKQKAKPIIASAIAMCPLINFRDTLDVHLSQGVISWFLETWAGYRMKGIENDLSELKSSSHFLRSLVENSKKEYWQSNDFWKQYQNIQTPVLIFSTEKDPLVLFDLNSKRLQSGYMNIGQSNLKVFSFPRGYHCSFPGAYKWQPIKNLLEQYYLTFE